MGDTRDFGGHSWEYHTHRIRRLQRLQLIALAVMCIGSIVVAVIFGRVLLNSSADQRTAANNLRSLTDVRTAILNLEIIVRRNQADPSRPLPIAQLLGEFIRFQSDARTLLDRRAGGDGPAATSARARVARNLDQLDGVVTPGVTRNLNTSEVATIAGRFSGDDFTLTASLEDWLSASSTAYADAVNRGQSLARRLFVATVVLMGLLGLLAWGWWVLLERARKTLTDSIGDSERRFRSLVQNSSDAVLVVGADCTIRYAAPPAEAMFGRAAGALVGTPLDALVDARTAGAMRRLRELGTGAMLSGETLAWQTAHPDGSFRFLESVATDLLDDPAIAGVVLNTRDVSDRHEAEMELVYRANHDALTDLANRSMFEQRIVRALERGVRDGVAPAVLILDLDDFKTINDSLGHVAGDELLIQVSERLRRCLRSNDLAARLGGDEFAILLDNPGDRAEAQAVAQRLVATIAQPITIEGRELEMRVSIGIAFAESGASPESLIRDADVAMYVAKDSGRAGWVVFDTTMSARASERLSLIADLRKAIERDEISVHYQPIVSLGDGHVAGLEALLRWRHPVRGWVEPGRFVELAEETGQIQEIGDWVLNRALDQMGDLDARVGRAQAPHIAVNVSIRQLEQEGFATSVAAALDRTGFSAARVILEITETALMRDQTTLLEQLAELNRLGVRIAIDDFGTGYSSLSYLAQLPIDIVKIDRAFIQGIGRGAKDVRIANMIMRIGESLSLRTIAEGVETEEQATALRDLGCAFAQGYLFGRPAPMDVIACLVSGVPAAVVAADRPLASA